MNALPLTRTDTLTISKRKGWKLLAPYLEDCWIVILLLFLGLILLWTLPFYMKKILPKEKPGQISRAITYRALLVPAAVIQQDVNNYPHSAGNEQERNHSFTYATLQHVRIGVQGRQ